MAYADYAYYTGTYGGSVIDEGDFTALIRKASAFLDRITYRRIPVGQPPPDAVSMAACAVAERIKANEQMAETLAYTTGVKSESTDGRSVTYADADAARSAIYADYADAAGLYLAGTGLLYAGVDVPGWC